MTFRQVHEEYEILIRLVSSERAALQERDESKMTSIGRQIEAHMNRVTEPLEFDPGTVDSQELLEIKEQLQALLDEIETSNEEWAAYHMELEEARRELNNARRFVREFQNPHSMKRMVHHSA